MLGEKLENVRKLNPLVHNITNYVTVNDCANILIACGGAPIMSDEIEDVKEITSICSALNINIGTLNHLTIPSMLEAGKILVQDNDTLINLPHELKEIEDQMNQIKKDSLKNKIAIRQAEKQKNDLLLYLAHDLKTPLTSIIGYLDLLNNQPNLLLEEKKTYAKIAYDKTIRLEELIEEFFVIAKYNLSDIELEKKSVNLSIMLAQIAYEFMPMYREKNIECVTNIEDNLNVSIDVNQFERVFDNLIRNAINYSINDSSINISAKKETNYIIIKLSNTVNLIDKNKLKHIFEPFVRLDKSRNSRTGGAGLGLTITKKIIELHGGTIDVDLDNNLIYFTIKIPM